MTTTNPVLFKPVFLRFFLLLGIVFLSGTTFSQLDSVSISNINFTQEIYVDSVTNVSDTVDVMNVDVYVNDTDFLGEIVVTVLDPSTDYPLAKQKLTKQEAIDEGLLTGNNIQVSLDYLTSPESYRIELIVRNYQGANLPMVSVLHN